MLRTNLILGCALGLLLICPAASAVVYVEIDGQSCGGCVNQLVNGHYGVELTTSGDYSAVVYSDDYFETDIVEYIHVQSGDNVTLSVIGYPLNARYIADLKEISINPQSFLTLTVDFVRAGMVGDITAHTIGTVSAVYGDVYGSISQIEPKEGVGGGIGVVQSSMDNVTGNVSAVRRISTVRALNGTIGTSGAHAAISSETSIGAIKAEAVYADISVTGAAADLDSLETTAGDFVGSLSCRKVVGTVGLGSYGLRVARDLSAAVTQTAVMNTGFRVGGSFTSGSSINLPPSGVTKQIIFAGSGTGSWSGSAHVNLSGSALTGEPYYTNPATGGGGVGGGAAGLATFHLHGVSCNPQDGDTSVVGRRAAFTCQGEDDCCLVFSKAVIRMYGPVSLHATLPSVTVKKWNGSSFVEVGWTPTTVHPASGDHREVEVKRVNGVWDLGDYLIEPISGKMACEDVDGTPDIATNANFQYMFSLIDACDEDSFVQGGYDRNSDNHITAADITAWVAAQCDLNNDGQITTADLVRLMRIVARFN